MVSVLKTLGLLFIVGGLAGMIYLTYQPSDDKPTFLSLGQLDTDADFTTFASKFRRNYKDTTEFNKRKSQFKKNQKIIADHNANAKRSFTLGVNQFTDWTQEEYAAMFKSGPETIDSSVTVIESAGGTRLLATLPTSVDWRTTGAVSSIKDQGSCGGCYAFAAVAALEGIMQIKYGTLYEFSPQQILDCSTNSGCNGGTRSASANYLKTSKAQTLTTYPFTGVANTCAYNSANGVVNVLSFTWAQPFLNVNTLLTAVAQQPVTVTIDASSSAFQSYSSGILDSLTCYGTAVNHSVLVVGYGTSGVTDYWIIKNTWGTAWGELGYVRITRNTTGTTNNIGVCGLLYQPLYINVA